MTTPTGIHKWRGKQPPVLVVVHYLKKHASSRSVKGPNKSATAAAAGSESSWPSLHSHLHHTCSPPLTPPHTRIVPHLHPHPHPHLLPHPHSPTPTCIPAPAPSPTIILAPTPAPVPIPTHTLTLHPYPYTDTCTLTLYVAVALQEGAGWGGRADTSVTLIRTKIFHITSVSSVYSYSPYPPLLPYLPDILGDVRNLTEFGRVCNIYIKVFTVGIFFMQQTILK